MIITDTPSDTIREIDERNAKCKDCIYDRLAGGTWRRTVQVVPGES